MRMALGQAPAPPLSSSVLDEPSWRASMSLMLGSGTAMGEATAKVTKSETVKNFMLRFLVIFWVMVAVAVGERKALSEGSSVSVESR